MFLYSHSCLSCCSRMDIAAGQSRITDRPSWASHMNSIENVWNAVKKASQEARLTDPQKKSEVLLALISDTWDEFASSQRCVRSLIWSTSRWMRSVLRLRESAHRQALKAL